MKKKPLNKLFAFLLLSLSIFALIIAIKGKEYIYTFNNVRANSVPTSLEPIPVKSNDEKESATTQKVVPTTVGTPAVLGCTVGSPCNYNNVMKPQPVCSQNQGTVNVSNGSVVSKSDTVKINKNSKIEIVEITAPIAILSGSQYVEDSRMGINKETGFGGTFKPASQLITEGDVSAQVNPGSGAIDKLNNKVKKGSFGVNVSVETSEKDSASNDENTAVLTDSLKSACPKVQKGGVNPDFTNKAASEILTPRLQNPGSKITDRNGDGGKCLDGGAGGVTLDSEFKSCVTNLLPFNFLVTAQVAADKWAECTVGDPANGVKPDPSKCGETFLYGLKVDALFGTPYGENNGQNASLYFDSVKTKATPPGAAAELVPEDLQDKASYKFPATTPFYAATPCKVRIDGNRIATVNCLWDLTPYKLEYDRQKKSCGPNCAKMPATFEEYWSYVDAEAKARGLQCFKST